MKNIKLNFGAEIFNNEKEKNETKEQNTKLYEHAEDNKYKKNKFKLCG